jgi:HD-GYP domain-containing protein (c-di-GMP phosphodiesterase class II)
MAERPARPTELVEEQAEQRQHEIATKLLVRLSALEQASRLYELHNAVVVNLFQEMGQLAQDFIEASGEPLELTLQGYSFFVNRRLLRMDFQSYRKAEVVKRLWNRVGLGGIIFPEVTNVEGLQRFAGAWLEAIHEPAKQAAFFAQEWGGIVVRRALDDTSEGPRIKAELYITRTYCALVVLTRQTIERFQQRRTLPMLRIKRTLQVLIDHLDGYRGLLFALARKPEFRGDLAAHMVSTGLLTMVLGRRAGIDRHQLVALGMAGLFHDLPKAGLNDATLNGLERPESMAAQDVDRVGQHWMRRIRELIALSGLTEDTLARVVAMYESQLEFGAELYGEEEQRFAVFSRLIRLVDHFDTASWTREGKPPMTGHEAMRAVLARAGGDYSPLLRLFIQVFGIYPTGSAVRLRSGELALVIDQSDSGDLLRPVVKVIADQHGKAINGPTADLSADPEYGVHGSVAMAELGVNSVAAFAKLAET